MSIIKAGFKWRTLMVLAPLVLLVVLAVATNGFINASSAAYGTYGINNSAPASQYGLSHDMLYVADGMGSDVKIIDVATMSIVDSIPVPQQPNGLAGLGMYWEDHGVVPSQDRKSLYTVGALSGGYLANAPYQMYQISTGGDGPKGTVMRSIPLATSAYDPVGYCGLEYNLNDENSNEIIAATMNTSDKDLMGMGAPNLNRPANEQVGGWSYENIGSTPGSTGFLSTDQDGDLESSTCGIGWDATGKYAYASEMWNTTLVTINWSSPTPDTGTGSLVPGTGLVHAGAATMYHQLTTDKARGLLYVTAETGYIEVFDIHTDPAHPALIGDINVRALTSSPDDNAHSIDLSPNNPDVAYVTSRNTANADGSNDNKELVLNLTDPTAASLLGSVGGLSTDVCGVYAIGNKEAYYAANNPNNTNNDMLFVANGSDSTVKVVDVGAMSIVDTIPVPRQPNGLAGLGMNWEVHGVVAGKNTAAGRLDIYADGALSGGYLASAPYQLYDINTASKATTRSIPLATSAYDPVGYCGLEYNLNDENSNELIAATMNTSDADLVGMGAPNLGRPANEQVGGWSYENIGSTPGSTGFLSTDQDGDLESSTCGIGWDATGKYAYASEMWNTTLVTINWSSPTPDTGTGSLVPGTGLKHAGAATMYHQLTTDKARGLLYVTAETGYIEVFDIHTDPAHPALIGDINVRALDGSSTTAAHSIDLSPNNPDIAYLTARNTPDTPSNAELILDVSTPGSATIKGSIEGFHDGVCGVYAIGDKSSYYGTMPSGLSLSVTKAYWASPADYSNHVLSVDYSIGNTGANADVNVVGTVNTGGVTSVAPVHVGIINSASDANATVQYNVGSATWFRTTVYATAQNGSQMASMPGPYPGP